MTDITGRFSAGKSVFLKKPINMTVKEAINVDPEILGGTPVFAGTRVPIKTLFDHLEVSSLEEFLQGFPSVKREQAEVVIEWAGDLVQMISQKYESAA